MAKNIVQRALGTIGSVLRDTVEGANSTFNPLGHSMQQHQRAADEGEQYLDAQWRERIEEVVIPAQRRFNQEIQESDVIHSRFKRAIEFINVYKHENGVK